jgi:hypothetical protein
LLISKKNHDSQGDTDNEEQFTQQPPQKDELPKAAISRSNMPSSNSNNNNKDDKDPYSGLKLVLRNTFDAINTVWSVVILFLGVSVSCGLVLNLLGYGYQVNPAAITLLLKPQQQQQDGSASSSSSSPPPLLRIDTIERFREETQFQREIYNSMNEKRQGDAAAAAAAAAATTTVTE